jgi:hypothetical protein
MDTDRDAIYCVLMKSRNPHLEQAGVARVYMALGIVGLVAGVGLLYQAIGEYRDHRRFPLKGALMPVGLNKMHLYCTGQGEPAVILEGPQTSLSAMWRPVQDAVSRFARVCSYDRAGFGWSELGSLPRTSERIASELHALLMQAGVAPPYVLVGASAGGFPVRVFAGRFPSEVAGVVLVDSSHPDQALRLHVPVNPAKDIQKWEARHSCNGLGSCASDYARSLDPLLSRRIPGTKSCISAKRRIPTRPYCGRASLGGECRSGAKKRRLGGETVTRPDR